MSNPLVIAAIFGIGFGGWVYNFVQKRNGGQSQQSLIVAAVVGLLGTIVFYTIFYTALSIWN